MPTLFRLSPRKSCIRELRRLVYLATTAGALACAPAAFSQEPRAASFVDEFESLDASRWYVSDGWVNGDHQNCGWSKNEVRVRDGKLRVGFSKTPAVGREYSCGEIQTLAALGHGTYEARIRTPATASGFNANFFTYIGQVHGKPHDEIDFEFLLKDLSKVQLNVFRNGKGGNEHFVSLPAPAAADYADYAFVWEPNALSWYVNNRLVHRIDDPAKVPANDAKIYLSLWGSDTLSDWMGTFVDPGRPIEMDVERVAFTAAGDACQFKTSLVCARNGTP